MKRPVLNLIAISAMFVWLVSCDHSRVFEAYQPLPEEGWHKDSVASFEVDIKDTVQNHNLYINVRNDINYLYSNLWIFMQIEQPGEKITTDTFEVLLADQTGKWLGEGFGGKKNRQVLYNSNVYFPVSGNYKISIQQGMRDELLENISDIGIRIEKAE